MNVFKNVAVDVLGQRSYVEMNLKKNKALWFLMVELFLVISFEKK